MCASLQESGVRGIGNAQSAPGGCGRLEQAKLDLGVAGQLRTAAEGPPVLAHTGDAFKKVKSERAQPGACISDSALRLAHPPPACTTEFEEWASSIFHCELEQSPPAKSIELSGDNVPN